MYFLYNIKKLGNDSQYLQNLWIYTELMTHFTHKNHNFGVFIYISFKNTLAIQFESDLIPL